MLSDLNITAIFFRLAMVVAVFVWLWRMHRSGVASAVQKDRDLFLAWLDRRSVQSSANAAKPGRSPFRAERDAWEAAVFEAVAWSLQQQQHLPKPDRKPPAVLDSDEKH